MAEGADREGTEKVEGQQGSAPVASATTGGPEAEPASEPSSDPAWPPREAAPRDVVGDDRASKDLPNVLSSADAPGSSTGKGADSGSATTSPIMLPPSEADA